MKIGRGVAFVFAIALLMASRPLLAHHGVPGTDMSKIVTIKGTVVDYLLINPHMEMRVKVTGDDGNPVEWNIEGVSLLMMMRAGYKRDTFKPGDAITVVGHPNKEGKPFMVLVKFVLPDGREMQSGYDGAR
jgi:hypothetical protein